MTRNASGNGIRHNFYYMLSILALGIVLMLCGCGTSKPSTLQEIVNASPDGEETLQTIANDYAHNINAASGIPTSADVRVVDNQMILSAYFQMPDEGQLLELLLSFATGQTDTLQEVAARLITIDAQKAVQHVRDIEEESGLEGVSLVYEIRETDGTLLAQAAYNSSGRIN